MTEPPYTQSEADALRLGVEPQQIWACWWCLSKGEPKPYWPAEKCSIPLRDHRIACPKHKGEPA
jgi:hypothetical protein